MPADLTKVELSCFTAVQELGRQGGHVLQVSGCAWLPGVWVAKFCGQMEAQIHLAMSEAPGVLPVAGRVVDEKMGEGILMPAADRDLQAELQAGRRVPPPRLADAARALLELHRLGWIHRDVHPGNLVFWQGRWRFIDFGLARECPASGFRCPRQSHAVIRFAALPQLQNEPEYPKDDWYSFGLVALAAFHGRMPWGDRREPQILLKKAQDPFSSFAGCQSGAILKAFAAIENPAEDTVLNLLDDLDSLACSCVDPA